MSDTQKAINIKADEQPKQMVDPSELFVELFEADKNRLYAYIYAYVMDYSAADDIFQETSMTLWREFSRFEIGTNFAKWANGIAFNRIRHFRQINNKYSLGLSDDFLLEFDKNLAIKVELREHLPDKWWHLQYCSRLLPDNLKQTYHAFYLNKFKAHEIAQQSGKSIHAVRKLVYRLRKQLFDCVARKSKEGGE